MGVRWASRGQEVEREEEGVKFGEERNEELTSSPEGSK